MTESMTTIDRSLVIPPLAAWQDDLDRPQQRRPHEADRRPDVAPVPRWIDGRFGLEAGILVRGSLTSSPTVPLRGEGAGPPTIPPRSARISRGILCKPDLHDYGNFFLRKPLATIRSFIMIERAKL